MAAELVPFLNRALNSNGSPISGARLFFYETGTTTPSTVYTGSDLATAHANPVVADSAGIFPAIYLDPSVTYRAILQDPAGAEIFDIDPINSSPGGSDGSAGVGFIASGAGAVSRTVQAKLRDTVSPKDYGAVGDGVADDTAAIEAADTYAAANGLVVFFPAGTYAASGLTLSAHLDMAPGAKLLFNGASNGTLATFSGSDKSIGRFAADGGTQNCTLLTVSGNSNTIKTLEARNVTASASGTSSLYGVNITGNDNVIGEINLFNFANTGFSNESFPQGVLFSGDKNYIGTATADTCESFILSGPASGSNSVGKIFVENGFDNGIYALGGTLTVGELTFYGTDEPLVVSDGAKLKIDRVNNYGSGICGLDDAGDVDIGHLHIDGAAGAIIRTRSGNVSSGRCTIGRVSGEYRGNSLLALDVGTVEYFTIQQMDVTFVYDAAVSAPITSWAKMEACEGFSLGDVNVKIVDEDNVLTSSDFFSLIGPTTNLAEFSFVSNLNVSIYNADGTTVSAAIFRGFNLFSSNLIHVEQGVIQTNIGPYLRETFSIYVRNSLTTVTSAAPTTGTWRRGQIVYDAFPAASGKLGFVCVSAGSPGTWRPFGAIDA